MAASNLININEPGIQDSLKKIFGGIIAGGLDSMNPQHVKIAQVKRKHLSEFLSLFRSRFPMQVFRDEYAVLYEMIVNQKESYFSEHSLRTVMEASFDRIMDSPYIDMSGIQFNINNGSVTDDEKFVIYFERVLSLFKELSTVEVYNSEEYLSACTIYIKWYKERFMTETTQNMAIIMSKDGFVYQKTRHRRYNLKGSEDARMYFSERMAVLDSMNEESAVKHEVFDADAYERYENNKDEDDGEPLLDYGLEVIDEVKGKMRRGNMIEVMGPPKGGKTTLMTYFVERALEQGLNVAVWPLEGTKSEWRSLITALMVRKDKNNSGMSLDKKDILEKSPNLKPEEKAAVSAATAKLAQDQSRGRLSFIDGPCYVEDIEDTLKYHYDNKNPFDVIAIDSPINVLSKSNTKKKNERISECYMTLKAFVSKKMKNKAICLCTAQLKQEVVDYIRSHPDEDLDVTAGGESAETVRTPDEVLGVFSTKQERSMNRLKLYDVASRHNRSFNTSFIHCELGCAYFECREDLNE